MENEYIVLKDAGGVLRPLAFITQNTEAGRLRAQGVRLEAGDTLVIVTLVEQGEYLAG